MDSVNETILAQYANGPSIRTIIEGFNQAIDPSTLIDLFYNNVFNPQTATGWGLDVWGRIVGVGRVYKVASSSYLGFDEADDGSGVIQPFGFGVFYNGEDASDNYALTDEWYRKLIFAKVQANISSGSIAELNAILMSIFSSSGLIWVEEASSTTMTVKYNWDISAVEAAILEQSGVLVRPSTVGISYARATSS